MDFNIKVNAELNGTKKIDDLEKRLDNLKDTTVSIKLDVDTSYLDKQLKGLTPTEQIKIDVDQKYLQNQINSALSGVKFQLNPSSYQTPAKQAGQNIGKLISDSVKKTIKISDAISSKSYDAKIASLNDKLSNYSSDSTQYETAKNSIKELEDAYKTLKDAKDAYDVDSSSDNYTKLVNANENLASVMKRTENEMKLLSIEQDKLLAPSVVASSQKSFVSYFENNTKAAKIYKEEVAELQKQLENMTTVADKAKFDTDFKNFQSMVISEGNTGTGLWEEVKRAFSQIGQFTGIYRVTSYVQQLPSQMIQAVYDIDTAMTNLYKVTEETDEKYQSFLSNAGTKAQALGRDMSSLITQTSEWAKLGYTLDEASQLSEVSSIYANVAEVDDATAVSDLVTAMKAFNIEAKDSISIADSLNALGNKFATSSADLGEGLSKSASALKTAGSDINEVLAMLTGGAEITQSAGEFGSFLKVASMRLRGMKGSLEELGEEVDDSVDTISKVQTQILNLTHGQVNIFDSNGEFRDYYEIMEEISAIHDKLSSTEQADITCLNVQKCA
jgi:TP901 family phage tail tape measure protein